MSFFNFTNAVFGSPPTSGTSQNMRNLVRSPSSPFCTSPSQLQEVTLDQDVSSFSNQMGIRSPGPMRGRTVKEFEEQLTNLKKENFNLKLRIYFLEEKMGTNFTLDKDNIVKKNVELQVEIANLQKEVKEKHELLCQAVKAMELEEDEHKKYSQCKEDEMAQLQQDMEDLRTQLQAKQQNQLSSYVFDKNESLKFQIDALQKDCQSKDQTINSLNRELSSVNERLIDFAQQVKEYEEKLAKAHVKNESLIIKMQEDQKTMEKLYGQLANVNQKYSVAKYEFEQERNACEREKKSLERNKMLLDMKNGALENETRKHKEVIRELQAKLEAAVTEAKKNQNLAVAKSGQDKLSNSNNNGDFVSVPDAAASYGTAKTDSLHVQINDRNSSKAQLPPTPDIKNLANFERLLTERGDSNEVLGEFANLKSEFAAQKQKIVKLKSEQLKACEIIKNMIEFRNKASEEIAQLKSEKENLEKEKENLEKELENVVSKPQKEKEVVPLHTRVSEMNITAVGTPPCETDRNISSFRRFFAAIGSKTFCLCGLNCI